MRRIYFSPIFIIIAILCSIIVYIDSLFTTPQPQEQNFDYTKNSVQKLFMELKTDTNEDELLKLIEKYSLKYSVSQYNTYSVLRKGSMERTNHYTISETGEIRRKLWDKDYIDVAFNDADLIIYSDYINHKVRVVSNNSVRFYPRISPGDNETHPLGYFVDMSSDSEKKDKGIELKDARGGVIKTSSYQYPNAEEAINETIRAAQEKKEK